MLNQVDVYDLLINSEREVGLEVYEYLGQVLVKIWNCVLLAAFPTKRFEFSYAREPDEYGPTVNFWQAS